MSRARPYTEIGGRNENNIMRNWFRPEHPFDNTYSGARLKNGAHTVSQYSADISV